MLGVFLEFQRQEMLTQLQRKERFYISLFPDVSFNFMVRNDMETKTLFLRMVLNCFTSYVRSTA